MKTTNISEGMAIISEGLTIIPNSIIPLVSLNDIARVSRDETNGIKLFGRFANTHDTKFRGAKYYGFYDFADPVSVEDCTNSIESENVEEIISVANKKRYYYIGSHFMKYGHGISRINLIMSNSVYCTAAATASISHSILIDAFPDLRDFNKYSFERLIHDAFWDENHDKSVSDVNDFCKYISNLGTSLNITINELYLNTDSDLEDFSDFICGIKTFFNSDNADINFFIPIDNTIEQAMHYACAKNGIVIETYIDAADVLNKENFRLL